MTLARREAGSSEDCHCFGSKRLTDCLESAETAENVAVDAVAGDAVVAGGDSVEAVNSSVDQKLVQQQLGKLLAVMRAAVLSCSKSPISTVLVRPSCRAAVQRQTHPWYSWTSVN